jgi:hypothetical protein
MIVIEHRTNTKQIQRTRHIKGKRQSTKGIAPSWHDTQPLVTQPATTESVETPCWAKVVLRWDVPQWEAEEAQRQKAVGMPNAVPQWEAEDMQNAEPQWELQ